VTVFLPGTDEQDTRKIILSIQQLGAGRSNAVGNVTLVTSVATTVVTDKNCAAGSTPIFTANTANAAAELASGNMYVSAVANGSFTITHTNSATTGRTFLYAIHG